MLEKILIFQKFFEYDFFVERYHVFEQTLIKDTVRYYVFIDEIQMVDGFVDAVNGLRIDYKADMYITGSNSKLLSTEINTMMRGRSIEIKVFPLSFSEYFSFYGGDIRRCFNSYLLYGGLPYLLSETEDSNKREYLRMIGDTVITKDIIERKKIKNENLFNALVDFLSSNVGSYVNANKIANTLKSNGFKGVTDDTIGNYLEYLCDAYLFYKAQRYDIKGKTFLKTQNQYYVSDLGVRNSRLNYRQIEVTHSLEIIISMDADPFSILENGYKKINVFDFLMDVKALERI